MAPPITTFDFYARQVGESTPSAPSCVTGCMSKGDSTGCEGPDDFACVCLSAKYSESVALCWIGQCNSDEITIGMRYTGSICAPYTNGAGQNGTDQPGGVPGTDPTAVPIISGQPHIYQKAFVNVQAIMSAICAAVLVIALVLGLISCRARVRAEREAAEGSTWSGGATYADTKTGKSHLFSQNGGATTTRNRESFDPTLSFQTLGHAPGRISVNRPERAHNGFTNRMTADEIEMSVQQTHHNAGGSKRSSSSGSNEGVIPEETESEMVETPNTVSTFATKIGDVDGDKGDDEGFVDIGSTADLTPKEKQGAFKGTAF